jgi:hypothetical protein
VAVVATLLSHFAFIVVENSWVWPWPSVCLMHTLFGTWRLRFGVDVPWHEHGLEIVSVDEDEVRGYVTIDWRNPDRGGRPRATCEADERRHELAFRASLDARCGLRFEIVVGAVLPRRYRFELFLVDNELVGFADITLDRSTAVTERVGVRAAAASRR